MDRNLVGRPRAEGGGQGSPADFNTAIIHLYRAQVAKANIWRIRLDTTTNWAVITTAAAISFAFSGTESERHVVILLITVLVTFFLLLEARRYRHYDMWQTNVHLIESRYFAQMLSSQETDGYPDWREVLAADLRQPHYYLTLGEALGWRLRRNYVWLYLTHLLTWLVKIAIHPEPIRSIDSFLVRASVGPIPGWAMILFGILFNFALVVAALLTWGQHQAGGEVLAAPASHQKVHEDDDFG